MSQRTSMVLTVEIMHAGQAHTASYFVEYNVVHARIGDRVLVVPVLGQDAATLVQDLLLQHVLRQTPLPAPSIAPSDLSASQSA